ncbi:AraC-type DNA-binding protein [Pseudobutyrivibrio sp. ACV-2]|uniref:helix-turn-helix domain-containing protein n=1 Tax=Pseudobutyrivibrio sp. ACV-2 TaxID=1520801 RepID=UPI00089BFA3D|nr:AraC family transcriptional regulator [Pseudobutyrivibrio sp. ACV-2]SEA91168.1 AraC-type DNA-binding protein [Pseudobutyrivibrio sp. ACV-2]
MKLNLNYLLEKTSRKLHTAIRLLDYHKEIMSKICLRMDLEDTELFSEILKLSSLSDYFEKTNLIPLLFSINKLFVYGLIKLEDAFLVVGPVKYSATYSLKENLMVTCNDDKWADIYDILIHIEWNDLSSCLLDVTNLCMVKERKLDITEDDIVSYNCISDNFDYLLRKDLERQIFEQQETGGHHNPYDQEVRELLAIENGDVEALKRSIAEDYTGQIGILAKDKFRSVKNVSIIVISIASRAAIKGGLSPEIAFSMADIYIKQIEEATSENLCMQMVRHAEYEFTKIVNEIKKEQATMNTFSGQENEHVMAAKNYIFKHLHGKISVAEIASALGLNANYLSGLFKNIEGISLKDYILNNKVTLVKNLLTYSAYNYSEISYYLGFSSQSHLGKVFKEKTGVTLSQYRAKYQLQEFLD